MKRIILLALIAISAAACEETSTSEKDKFEFGEPGNFIELEMKDGKYVPKRTPVSQETFDALFKESWKLKKVSFASSTGKITDAAATYSSAFSVRESRIIRQYDGKGAYIDGTYSYDSANGIICFTDVMDIHPEFHLISLEDNEMSGAFIGPDNTSDDSVLTIFVYQKLGPDNPMIQY